MEGFGSVSIYGRMEVRVKVELGLRVGWVQVGYAGAEEWGTGWI